MVTKEPLPTTLSLDEVKVRIIESFRNPNIRSTKQIVLKDGPRTFKIATLFEIVNPKTKEFHHYSLRLDSIDHLKSGWFSKPEKSISLENDGVKEIENLSKFLRAVFEEKLPSHGAEIHILDSKDYYKLEKVIEAIPQLAAIDKIELIKALLDKIDEASSYAEDFVSIFDSSKERVLQSVSVAAKYVEYRKKVEQLESLISTPTTLEPEFQKHLSESPWIFGSEYSELLDRREWTRGKQCDFMLRRTVDGYLEVIEIKRAIKEKLLVKDPSHNSYYPSSVLSQAIGQVMGYIEDIERNRDSIIAKDRCDPGRIRGRIVIGRDGSEEEQNALHSLNSHLHRIEIMTYDQLQRIGKRTIDLFEQKISTKAPLATDPDPDLPF